MSLAAVSQGARGTYPGARLDDRREADRHQLTVPAGVGRVSITLTRLDQRAAGVAEVVVGAQRFTVRTTADRADLLDEQGDISASATLGAAGRIELGVGVLPTCDTACAALLLPGAPTRLFLGDGTGANGSSDGIVIHRVDLFDR